MTEENKFRIRHGNSPLLISIPHLGTEIPEELRDCYSKAAMDLSDTDWHLDRLYNFATRFDATVIRPRYSRYVIDLNRPATGESLYPGMVTTTLCPLETFRGEALYKPGMEPTDVEIARRVATYWRPYHDALKSELTRLRSGHDNVLLWEAHSIASLLPRLFDGKLPDLNFGTSDGDSCGETVIAGALDAIRDSDVSWVLNGRFKGGFITRKYGSPQSGVHAIQLELCQSTYMEEFAPFEWRADLASNVAPLIEGAIAGALSSL
jgi:N-formylglutamate deformylase